MHMKIADSILKRPIVKFYPRLKWTGPDNDMAQLYLHTCDKFQRGIRESSFQGDLSKMYLWKFSIQMREISKVWWKVVF